MVHPFSINMFLRPTQVKFQDVIISFAKPTRELIAISFVADYNTGNN